MFSNVPKYYSWIVPSGIVAPDRSAPDRSAPDSITNPFTIFADAVVVGDSVVADDSFVVVVDPHADIANTIKTDNNFLDLVIPHALVFVYPVKYLFNACHVRITQDCPQSRIPEEKYTF